MKVVLFQGDFHQLFCHAGFRARRICILVIDLYIYQVVLIIALGEVAAYFGGFLMPLSHKHLASLLRTTK